LVVTAALIVGLFDGVILADAKSDYEMLFGAEAKRVAATRTKTDDAAFAAKLIKAAKDMPDSPTLQVELYQKACQFGTTGAAGYGTALEALELLEKAVPKEKAQWQQKKLGIMKHRFETSSGQAKRSAAIPYVEIVETIADAKVAKGKWPEAKALYTRALAIANYAKLDRLSEIVDKRNRVDALMAQEAKIKSLHAKLTRNTKDTTTREQLILLYVIGLDKPQEAVTLLTDEVDESIRTYVQLATKDPDQLTETACRDMGNWYYQVLAKKAPTIFKHTMLTRAKTYYERFLKLHTKKDVQSYRAKATLGRIENELEELGARARSFLTRKTLVINIDKRLKMKLVLIPAGTFIMGSPKSEKGRRNNEGPLRKITITKPFYMSITEVTQEQYAAVTGQNRSAFKGPKNPVERVSPKDSVEFCNILSERTGKAVGLPTEAQWEYACRARTKTRFSFSEKTGSLDKYGNYCDKSNTEGSPHQDKDHNDGYGNTAPVGSYKPNAFGLYDMHGNVAEWCSDWFADSYIGSDTRDPKGPASGKSRVFRGGSWRSSLQDCRAAWRSYSTPEYRNFFLGFRVVVPFGSTGRTKSRSR